MNRKKMLISSLGIMAILSLIAVGYVFISALKPGKNVQSKLSNFLVSEMEIGADKTVEFFGEPLWIIKVGMSDFRV